MNRYIKIIIAAVVVIGVLFFGMDAIKKAKQKDANFPKAKIYPIVVKTITPKLTHVVLTLPDLAQVQNDKSVKLASRVSGRILKIKTSGSMVKKGEVVARIDTTTIQSDLQSVKDQITGTQITLHNLEQVHKRTLELLKVGGASLERSQKEQSEIAKTEANLSSLEQKKISLENSLTYGVVRSPVAGIITKTFGTKGAMAMPGKPLAFISAKNGFYLLVRVPSDVPVRGVIFQGKKYKTVTLASASHGLVEYKVYINDHHLTSGERVEISLITFSKKAILLPFNAILSQGDKNLVLFVKADHAVAHAVNVIQTAQQGVVVLDNIEGKKVITAAPDILLKLLTGHILKIKD